MPASKELLSDREIWTLVVYLRHLPPAVAWANRACIRERNMRSEMRGEFTPDGGERLGACFSEVFFPLGFAVLILTNRAEALDAARSSWGSCSLMSALEPLVIHLDFFSDLSPIGAEAAHTHVEERFLTVDFGEQGIVVADLQQGIARGVLSEVLLASDSHLRYYVLEAVALSMISTLRAVALHAACVSWKGNGLLLCGESGAGKTTLAYACARFGWTYVSDDASYLMFESQTRTVVGNSHRIRFRDAATQLFDELRGKQVTPRIAGKPSIELPTAELEDIRVAAYADIAFILFLNRDGELRPTITSIERSRAKEYFEQYFLVSPDPQSSTSEALERLLTVPVFELRYAGLESAVSLMTQIADGASTWPIN